MTRKCLYAALGVALLGGVVTAARPLLAQFIPFPGPCPASPQVKPVVTKYPAGKTLAQPAKPQSAPDVKPPAASPAKPPEVKIFSSGPLPQTEVPPTLPGASEPDEAWFPDPDDVSIYPPKPNPKSPAKPEPPPDQEPPLAVEPSFKPAGAKDDGTKDPPTPSAPKVEAKKDPPPPAVEPFPELPPGHPAVKPAPADDPIKLPMPKGPELAPVKPAPESNKPLDFTVPAGKPSSPWVIQVKVIKTMTHLIATSKSAEFHVDCQNLKVQSPTGDIQAEGEIKVSAAGLEMNCERLTISWQNDWVVMEGKVRLQTEKGGQQLELSGDKLQLKLTALTSPTALKSLAPKLHNSAYPPPVLESVTPTKQASPAPPAPGGGSKLQPFYKRVTEDE